MKYSGFILESKMYEESIDQKTKKENGIYYTEIELAIEIIKHINIDKKATICDPCCGTGSFLFALKKLGYENIYGADIDSNAITYASNWGSKNTFVLDTIFSNGDEILRQMNQLELFDFIIGNPPYFPLRASSNNQINDFLFRRELKNSGNNLFIGALLKAFDIVKPNGVVSYIIPKNFLHVSSYKTLRKKILNEKDIISIVDLGSQFKNVRGEQIVLTVKNSKSRGGKISFYKYKQGSFQLETKVLQSVFENEILLLRSKEDQLIYEKLERTYQKLSDVCNGYVGRGKSKSQNAITGKDIRKFSFKDRMVPDSGNKVFIQNIYSAESGIIAAFAGNMEATETVTVFTDGDELMCRYIVGLLHSRLCNYYLLRYCFNDSRLTMHTDARYLKRIPLVIDEKYFHTIVDTVKSLEVLHYLSDEWYIAVEYLNILVYKIYGISEKERVYIENHIQKVQSKRWKYDK